MGVSGLLSYVNSHPSLGKSITFSPSHEKHGAVIDGNALMHHIYLSNLEWVFGGEYSCYAGVLEKYFRILQASGLEIKGVLFDGSLPPAKSQVRYQRDNNKISRSTSTVRSLTSNVHQSRILSEGSFKSNNIKSSYSSLSILPPLTFQCTIDVLKSLGVPVQICTGEADSEVGRLARDINAIMISKDTDYLIFNVESGYIPLDSIQIDDFDLIQLDPLTKTLTLPTHSQQSQSPYTPRVTAVIYFPSALSSHLNVSSQFMPLLASLLGNDYMSEDIMSHSIYKRYHVSVTSLSFSSKIRTLSEFMQQFKALEIGETVDKVVDSVFTDGKTKNRKSKTKSKKSKLKNLGSSDGTTLDYHLNRKQTIKSLLLQSISQYSLVSTICPITSGLNLTLQNAVRENKFSSKLLDVLFYRQFWCTPFLEDTDLESSWMMSESIRVYVYSVLEYLRLPSDERSVVSGDVDRMDLDMNGEEGETIVEEHMRNRFVLAPRVVSLLSTLTIRKFLDSFSSSSPLTDTLTPSTSILNIPFIQSYFSITDTPIVMLQSYFNSPSNSPFPQPTTPSQRMVHLPLIAALRYFIIQTSKQSQNLTNTEILAFILSYLSPVQSTPNNDPHPLHSVSPTMTKRSIHHVAQFQNILKSLEMWAQVLSVVYPPPSSPPPSSSSSSSSPSSTTSSFIHHNDPSSRPPIQPNLQNKNKNKNTQSFNSQIQSLHTTFTTTSYKYFNGFSFYVYLHLLKGGTSISKILVSSQPHSVSSQSNTEVPKSKYTELVLLYQFITKNLDHCIDVVVWYPDLNDTVTNSDTFGLNDKEVSQTTKKQKGSHGRGRGGGKMKSGGYLKSRMVKDESRIDGGKGIKGGKKGGGKEKDVLFEMLSGGCSFYAG